MITFIWLIARVLYPYTASTDGLMSYLPFPALASEATNVDQWFDVLSAFPSPG
jgi:hypothetical protein